MGGLSRSGALRRLKRQRLRDAEARAQELEWLPFDAVMRILAYGARGRGNSLVWWSRGPYTLPPEENRE